MPCSLIICILPTLLPHWITDFLGGACRRSSRGKEQPELSRAERINAYFSTLSSWFWTPQEAASAVHRGMSSSDALQTFNHLPKPSHVEKTIGKSNEVAAAKYYFFVPEHMVSTWDCEGRLPSLQAQFDLTRADCPVGAPHRGSSGRRGQDGAGPADCPVGAPHRGSSGRRGQDGAGPAD